MTEVGLLVFVDRRRDGDDVEVAIGEIANVERIGQIVHRPQLHLAQFERLVAPGAQRLDARRIDVKADNRKPLREFDRERQANVSEADHRELQFGQVFHEDRELESGGSAIKGETPQVTLESGGAPSLRPTPLNEASVWLHPLCARILTVKRCAAAGHHSADQSTKHFSRYARILTVNGSIFTES